MISTAKLKEIFGGICAVPEGGSRSAAVEIQISGEVWEKLLAHWKTIPTKELPRLRGITVNRPANGEARKMQLLIDAGRGCPIVLLSVEWAAQKNFASLHGIWPYTAWWEMELAKFDSCAFLGAATEGGVSWRHA